MDFSFPLKKEESFFSEVLFKLVLPKRNGECVITPSEETFVRMTDKQQQWNKFSALSASIGKEQF